MAKEARDAALAARDVAIPCSKGLLLHDANTYTTTAPGGTTVAIPCSKGLLLHGSKCEMMKDQGYRESRNPLFKGSTVACVWRIVQRHFQMLARRNPLFKGSTVACDCDDSGHRYGEHESQSPVQRVYCCMLFVLITVAAPTTRSRNPLFKGSTVACHASASSSRTTRACRNPLFKGSTVA